MHFKLAPIRPACTLPWQVACRGFRHRHSHIHTPDHKREKETGNRAWTGTLGKSLPPTLCQTLILWKLFPISLSSKPGRPCNGRVDDHLFGPHFKSLAFWFLHLCQGTLFYPCACLGFASGYHPRGNLVVSSPRISPSQVPRNPDGLSKSTRSSFLSLHLFAFFLQIAPDSASKCTWWHDPCGVRVI